MQRKVVVAERGAAAGLCRVPGIVKRVHLKCNTVVDAAIAQAAAAVTTNISTRAVFSAAGYSVCLAACGILNDERHAIRGVAIAAALVVDLDGIPGGKAIHDILRDGEPHARVLASSIRRDL